MPFTPAHRVLPAVHRWLDDNRFLVVFALLASFMGTSVGTAKVLVSLHALHLGANEAQLGLVAAGQMVGVLVMSLPVGFLVDHHGPARLFVIGSVLAGLAYAVIPLVDHLAFLAGCVTAIGFFMPLRFVSLNTVFFAQIQQLGEHKAGWYRGTHMAGMHLLGPGLAVALAAGVGLAGSWWVIAASFAVTVALSPVVFGRYGPPRVRAQRPSWAALRRDFATLATDAELRQVNLIDFCAQATQAFQVTFVIAIGLKVFHLSPSEAAAYVSGHGLGFIVTLFAGGMLVRRVGVQRACLIGFVASAVALASLALAQSPALLWPGVLLLAGALGLLQIVSLTRMARIGARLGQGKVSGLNLMVGPSGALVGTLLGGLAGHRLGLQNAYALFVPVHLLLAAWTLRTAVTTAPVAATP